MANTAQFIYSELLTNYGIKAGVGSFGASVAVAPLQRSPNINGTYLERERALIGSMDARRAPGEKYKYKQPAKGELKGYQITDHGIVIPVPMELVDGYSATDLFGEKINASVEALDEVRYAHAVAVNSTVWAATEGGFDAIYGAANVNIPATKWNAVGSTIEADVAAAKERVRINSGYAANVVAMPQIVFDAITNSANSSVYDKLKYTSGGVVTRQMLASLFGVEEVIVFGELANSANPGQTPAYGDLYAGDHVLVFHRNSLPGTNRMNLAQTFYWDNARAPFMGVMERFNLDTNSYEFKASAYFEVKLTAAVAGNVLYDVLT